MDPTHLQRVRQWAAENGERLTPKTHAAAATALAAAENGVSAEDRSAALKWARTAARRGATAAERSAARSIVALLEDGPEPRARERPVEPAEVSESHEEQPVIPKERVEARPWRSRASAGDDPPAPRRRAGSGRSDRSPHGGGCGRTERLRAVSEGDRARPWHARGRRRPGEARVHRDRREQRAVELDGSDVSARATRKGSTETRTRTCSEAGLSRLCPRSAHRCWNLRSPKASRLAASLEADGSFRRLRLGRASAGAPPARLWQGEASAGDSARYGHVDGADHECRPGERQRPGAPRAAAYRARWLRVG